ncbi:hypothetical protein [Sporolactobacillus terrae]|uniref:hypothetical protein n=1 Tax=Sporolactobacillus terrae TaxID=269673 RepID=UPI000B303FDC|nr:hypothetical protein [Sporolactobacillus terrae]
MNRSENSKKSISSDSNRSRKRGHCSEKMPQHVIEDLMGIHGPTYRRVKGGAFKQK